MSAETEEALKLYRQQIRMARASFSEERFEEALDILSAIGQPINDQLKLRANIIRARVYLALEQPVRAIEILNEHAIGENHNAECFGLMIRALSVSGRIDEASHFAGLALGKYSDPAVSLASFTHFINIGALEDAAGLIPGLPPYPSNWKFLLRFAAESLMTDRVDLIQNCTDILKAHRISFFDVGRAALRKSVSAGKRGKTEIADVVRAIGKAKGLIENSSEAYAMARLLFRYGDFEEATLFMKLSKTLPNEVELSDIPTRSIVHKQAPFLAAETKALDDLAEWIGVATDDRDSWKNQVSKKRARDQIINQNLLSSSEFFEEFNRSIIPGSWEPLKELVRSDKPAIVALTHFGSIVASFLQIVSQELPITSIGGEPILRRLLPGRERFLPIERGDSEKSIARKLIRLIKAGNIIALAADGRSGSGFHRFEHDGLVFNLPVHVPKLAFEYQLPLFFVCTYWHNNKFICEVDIFSSPTASETREEYRDRWFVYFLEKLREVGRADVRNVMDFYGMEKVM